jgi:predicted DNA-binding transcriptional regulator AlpA
MNKLVTREGGAVICGVSVRKFDVMMQTEPDAPRALRFGRTLRYSEDALRAWLERRANGEAA